MDFHTHNLQAPAGTAIVNLPREAILNPSGFTLTPGGLYSAGIHPWWTEDVSEQEIDRLVEGLQLWVRNPQVVAIGECGYDRLKGGPIELQREAFEWQARLSDQLRKPLTVHCVRAFDLLLASSKKLHPIMRWTVHGFRGKPALAEQLLAAGMDLSFGKKRNQQSYDITPPLRRHEETDEDF